MRNLRLLLLPAGLLAGCILDPIGAIRKPNPQIILQAFLTPDAPVDSVVLRTTVPADEYYTWMDLSPYAISNANVVIANGGQSYTLTERAPGTGTYAHPTLTARSGQVYSIEVTFPPGHGFAGRRLTASTTVPNSVHATATLNPSQTAKGVTSLNELVFPKQLADPGRFGITSSTTPFRLAWNDAGAGGYLVGALSLDTSAVGLLRYRMWDDYVGNPDSTQDDGDWDFKSPSQRQFLHKSGYIGFPDSLSADVYWLLFYYRGAYDVAVIAADEGYYDYFASVANGPAGQSGSDADFGIVSNVKGGTGVFGSYSADTVHAFITPEWLPSDHLP